MNLTPRGVHKCGRPVLILDSFHPYSVLVCLEWFFMHIPHISSDQNCEKLIFRPFFWQNFGVWPPVVLRERVNPWGVCTFLKLFYTYFKNNFDFSWFFIIILVKMSKNVQNLAIFGGSPGLNNGVENFSNILFQWNLQLIGFNFPMRIIFIVYSYGCYIQK